MKAPLATNGGRRNLLGVPPVLVDGENYKAARAQSSPVLWQQPASLRGRAAIVAKRCGVILLFERFPNMTLPDPASVRWHGLQVRSVFLQIAELPRRMQGGDTREPCCTIFRRGSSFVDPYGPRERHLPEAFSSVGRNLVCGALHAVFFCGESACLHTRGSHCRYVLTFNLDL